MIKSREVRLKSRPIGPVALENFELATVNVPSPQDGEALIKNLWMSIDAGQRTLMGSGDADIADLPPKRFELNEPMECQAIGQVIESHDSNLPVGTFVSSNFGWREYFVFKGKQDGFTLTKLEVPVSPLQAHLHIMSVYGATAYYFITQCAKVQAGETVWISTAAGTTGSMACQIAQISGCKVIGTTGSDRKVEWLMEELGLDAAFNYHAPDLRDAIKAACPEGIDVYLDFVGGHQLETAIDLMNPQGRIIKVGETSSYDGGKTDGPGNLFQIVLKRLDLLGRSVFDILAQPARMENVYARLGKWHADGTIKVQETVYEGIENAAQAQIDLLGGKNIGKMLVKVGEPENIR
ncbi:MAG: NADP-dependent oxidoreductase [Marinicaulis sp.]|nr:NADP-dependent oxidoreductase [Marinicaulis sp.]